LAVKYNVTRQTVNKIIRRSRDTDYSIHKSTNKRFRCLPYGLKRLAKVEKELEKKLKEKAKRYHKQYPGEMLHVDTKRLPILTGESPHKAREYLFVAVDDYSRELYAAILPDKTQFSAEACLKQVIDACPYTIEQLYTDNGLEYKGSPDNHALMRLCRENKMEQRFTKVKSPQTHGKAEHVIRTLMDIWHTKTHFKGRVHRKTELIRFVN
jgi:transposase InsO family protein